MTLVPVADAHSDLLCELVFATATDGEVNPFRTRWLAPLRQGGVVLQVCAVYAERQSPPDAGLREALRQVHAFHDAVGANPDAVLHVTRGRHLDAVGPHRVGLLLALEGVDFLGEDPGFVEELVALGVRMVSLTHNGANGYAGGCATEQGLTDAGARLVDRLTELGVLVDLAHASRRTVADVLERVAPGTVLVSHAACDAVHPSPRNVTDDQLTALAEKNGVLGLMPHPYVVDAARHDLDRFVDHVDHAVSVIGAGRVALGGDFLRQIARALGLTKLITPADTNLPPDTALDGLEGPQDYPALAERLRVRGYDGDGVAALMSGNLLRALRRALPA